MNRYPKWFFVIIALLFLVPVQALAYSVAYDQKISLDGEPIAEIKVTVKDQWMRAESNFGGLQTVMLRNDSGIYSYLPAQQTATRIPPEMDRPNLTRDLPRFMDFLKENNAQKVGTENIEGRELDVYTFTEPTIQQQAKAWVWPDKNFPVKIEVPAPEGVTTVELQNIEFEPKVEDSVFKLPSGTKVLDLQAQAAAQAEQALPPAE